MADPIKTDAETAFKDVKLTITELEDDGRVTITKVKSVWTHYEIWIVLGVSLIAGFIVGHWVF